MSYNDLSVPHTAASREPAQHESRHLEVTAKPRRTPADHEVDRDSSRRAPEAVLARADTNAAGEADTDVPYFELAYDTYVFGRGSAEDIIFDEDV